MKQKEKKVKRVTEVVTKTSTSFDYTFLLNQKIKKSSPQENNGKGDKGKERASRHNNVGGGSGSADKRNNKNIENSSQSKRSVGRPPKKAAETNAGSAKRGRENSASAGKDKRPKKRSKK